jgi:hypothetical protein
MPRRPTAADYKALRRIYDHAGSREELNRWIDTALGQGKQRRGPKEYRERFKFGDLERVAAAANRTAAIRQLVRDNPALKGRGTEDSAVERVRLKLRKLDDQLRPMVRAFEKLDDQLRPMVRALEEELRKRQLIRARIK